MAAGLVALAGCGGGEDAQLANEASVDPGDRLQGQGVEIVDGRFVPDLVAVDAAQPVEFLNRDEVPRRVVKVRGPGQGFRSGVIRPGESYRLSLVGAEGRRLGSGTVTYRGGRRGGPTGRIRVYGTALPRREDPDRATFEANPPESPDRAAQHRARRLAAYVSQCEDYRRCDTPRELVARAGGGTALRFVPGSGGSAIESDVATHGPRIPIGPGPDETEIEATGGRFAIVAHSRTGRDFVVEGSGRDPEGWSRRCAPAGGGQCGSGGRWR